MFKLLIALILAVILIKIGYLLVKRLWLHCKIKKACKKLNVEMKSVSCWWKSIFVGRGRTDYLIDNKLKVSVLTLPFRRVRCHFMPDKGQVEIIVGLGQFFLINPVVPKGVASISNVFKLASFNVCLDHNDEFKHIMIVYPVSKEVSCVKKNRTECLYNGDEITNGIVFNTSSYFFENLEQYLQ